MPWVMGAINRDIDVELPMSMVMISFLEIAEETRCEVAALSVMESILMMLHIGTVVLTFHRLKAVTRAEEALYFRVILVIVHGLDLIWVLHLELYIMELVREASMGTMKLCHWPLRFMNSLGCLKVELIILCVYVLVNISVARHFAVLINNLTLLTESLSRWLNQLCLRAVRLDRATKGLWMRVSLLWCFVPLGLMLIWLLGRSSFFLLVQVLVNFSLESKRLCPMLLFRFSLILGLVINLELIVKWFTRHQRNVLLARSVVSIFEVVFSWLR